MRTSSSAAALACLTMFPLSGQAQTMEVIEAASEAIYPFYCQPTVGDAKLFIFVPLKNGSMDVFPSGIGARRVGDVFTADTLTGTISISDGQYASLTEDGLVIGTCQPFSGELMQFIWALYEGSPDTVSALVQSGVLDTIQAQTQAAESRADALQERVKELENNMGAAKVAALASVPDEIKRLKRENDKLKRRVCEIDPKATFTVCKDGSAP